MEGTQLIMMKGYVVDDILFDIGFFNPMNVPQNFLGFYLLYHAIIIWCIFIYILIKNLSESYSLITTISAIALVFSIIFQSFMMFSLYGYRNVLIIPIGYGVPIIFFIICCYFSNKLLAMAYVVYQTIISLLVTVILYWGQPWMTDGKDLLYYNVFFYYYKVLTEKDILEYINDAVYKIDYNVYLNIVSNYKDIYVEAMHLSTRAELDNLLAMYFHGNVENNIVINIIVSHMNDFIGMYGYSFWCSLFIYIIIYIKLIKDLRML